MEDTSVIFHNTKPGSSYILIIRTYSRDVTKFNLLVTDLPTAVAKKRYSGMHGHAHTHPLLFFLRKKRLRLYEKQSASQLSKRDCSYRKHISEVRINY